jgi:hypothetical protein
MNYFAVSTEPSIQRVNYRLKINVSFLDKYSQFINEYKDNITNINLLKKINYVLNIIKKYNIKIPSAIFQKSNYNDGGCSIIFEHDLHSKLFDELLLDTNIKVIYYMYDSTYLNYTNNLYIDYIHKDYKNKEFLWYTSPMAFFQSNPETSNQIHNIVCNAILQSNCKNYYGLGGEMGLYANMFKNYFQSITCIAGYKSIQDEYFYNTGESCHLVDYYNLNLCKYVNTLCGNILLINISKNGLKNLAVQVLNLNIDDIIYIGCCEKYIKIDIDILNERYKINKVFKINQFPGTEYYIYIIHMLKN